MNEKLSSERFSGVVDRVVESSRNGILLTDELIGSVLHEIPERINDSDRELVARIIRSLDPFCDWARHGLAIKYLQSGGSPDELHLEIQRIEDSRLEVSNSSEHTRFIEAVISGVDEIYHQTSQFFDRVRSVETLMGYDQDVTNELFVTLGVWNDSASKMSLLALLPEELTFPLKDFDPPIYDHRLHGFVLELLTRLGEEGRVGVSIVGGKFGTTESSDG